jgi:hypothetical protein
VAQLYPRALGSSGTSGVPLPVPTIVGPGGDFIFRHNTSYPAFNGTKVTDTDEDVWRRDRDTDGVCFTLEATEYFTHQLSEADWLTTARASRCAEASKTQLPPALKLVL